MEPRVEVIISIQRRRPWSTAENVLLVEETTQPGRSVSFVAAERTSRRARCLIGGGIRSKLG
jgi:hypothetical protein